MNKLSLKTKITLWYLLIITAISVAILSGMTTLTRTIIINDVKESVVASVTDLETKLLDMPQNAHKSSLSPELIPLHALYGKGTQTVIYNSDKDLIFGSAPYGIENILSFFNDSLRIESYNGKEYYVYDKKVEINENFVWIKGISCISDKTSFLDLALQNNAIIAACFILIAGLGGYLIMNKALLPVNKINETANNIINTNNISQRINISSGNDEIHALANTVDNMLDRIEASLMKERQFTSDASHELRTPISVILSECEYAEDCISEIEDYKESILSIKNQAQKMSNLVSELLAISRMDNEKITINKEETDLSELLEVVCDEQINTHSSEIKLEKYIEPQIIETIDQLLITRLFINIISNAYQYSEPDTVIRVYLYKENNQTVFSVKDEGIGIDEEHIDKIWNRFYQVDSSRNKNTSGLGLSMVKWIADKHEIKIKVESIINKGTQFTFFFEKTQ